MVEVTPTSEKGGLFACDVLIGFGVCSKEIMKDRPELSWSEAADIFKSAIPQVGEDVEDEDAVKFLQSKPNNKYMRGILGAARCYSSH